MPRFIDVHVHLNMLKTDPLEELERARLAGVDRVITIGTEPDDHELVLDYARRFFPQVACTLGIHPHAAELWNEGINEWIRAQVRSSDVATSRGIVAIGEIGLDYYYNKSPSATQLQAFRRQMDLAAELNLPVEIHTRDAEADTALILKEYAGRVGGLLHCFTSSLDLAEQALNFGFDISISGVATFKNAEALRDVVRFVPLERLHVETDAPFLAPVPQRGKSNVPSFVVHTAELVAKLKGVTIDALSAQTLANAKRLFPKLEL